jgi:D-arabinose 1-dehydrogenase-like Zn-dependent alcohol dehydrogenase
MRAMQIIEWGKPLEAREYPDPEPKGEEVLLRVEAAGVCHSDVHIWDGHFDLGGGQQISLESRGVRLPFTMGHEIAGEVVALGPHFGRQSRRQGGSLSVDRLWGVRGVPEG